MYPAHVRVIKENGISIEEEQSVRDHLRNVSVYTRESLSSIGLGALGELVGILHDFGKLCTAFQDYLYKAVREGNARKGSVIHTFQGIIYLKEFVHPNDKDAYMTWEIIAYAIGAHHGVFDLYGMDKTFGLDSRLQSEQEKTHMEECTRGFYSEVGTRDEVQTLFNKSVEEYKQIYGRVKECPGGGLEKKFYVGFVCRTVLSALIDADRRDTAEFMANESYSYPQMKKADWEKLSTQMQKSLGHYPDTNINRVRQYISDECAGFARNNTGIYQLSVPTGAGKTLSTLRYALVHAANHNKKRIIFIAPLLTIIEQNADAIRQCFDDPTLVLEHHSNVLKDEALLDESMTYEIYAESWKSVIVVSTLYQLLCTLFDGKTSSIRRLQALENSVLVIDEVQSLPVKMTSMFCLALNYLNRFFNTTVVLCSATQPAFENLRHSILLSDNSNMITLSADRMHCFHRTRIVPLLKPNPGWRHDEIASFLQEEIEHKESILMICNTQRDAKELYHILKDQLDEEIELFYLSSGKCVAHRREELIKIKECLGHRRCICVSTQVVEAGVDISFETVVRALAGVDNIVQAAGRCNRSGKFGHVCDVYVINVANEKLAALQEIAEAQKATRGVLEAHKGEDFDLSSETGIREYYQSFYCGVEEKLTYEVKPINTNMLDLLSRNAVVRDEKQPSWRLHHAFKTAAEYFTVYDVATTEVVCRYKGSEDLLCDLNSQKALQETKYERQCLEKLKPYVIQLFQYQLNELQNMGYLRQDPSGRGRYIELDYRCYNEDTGFDIQYTT